MILYILYVCIFSSTLHLCAVTENLTMGKPVGGYNQKDNKKVYTAQEVSLSSLRDAVEANIRLIETLKMPVAWNIIDDIKINVIKSKMMQEAGVQQKEVVIKQKKEQAKKHISQLESNFIQKYNITADFLKNILLKRYGKHLLQYPDPVAGKIVALELLNYGNDIAANQVQASCYMIYGYLLSNIMSQISDVTCLLEIVEQDQKEGNNPAGIFHVSNDEVKAMQEYIQFLENQKNICILGYSKYLDEILKLTNQYIHYFSGITKYHKEYDLLKAYHSRFELLVNKINAKQPKNKKKGWLAWLGL